MAVSIKVMTISIIVPMLNEAENLLGFIQQLKRLSPAPFEVVFVDGGSSDGSDQLAAASGFKLIQTEKGRALQQNAGAKIATGQVLLFLHADTTLAIDAIAVLQNSLKPPKIWGRFDVQLSSDLKILKVVSWMINWRSRWSGIATGDQAIFVVKTAFNAIGGFASQPLMEDVEISKQLKRQQAPICLKQKVMTSARRWEQYGVWRTIFLMWRLRFLYWLGVPADQLVKRYQYEK